MLVVEENLEVRFVHPLLASAVYGRMDMLARRSLHAELARTASDGFVVVELVPLVAVVGRRPCSPVGIGSTSGHRNDVYPATSCEASHAWPASQNERKSQWVHHRPGAGSNAPSPIAVSEASTRSRTTAGSSIGFVTSSPLAR